MPTRMQIAAIAGQTKESLIGLQLASIAERERLWQRLADAEAENVKLAEQLATWETYFGLWATPDGQRFEYVPASREAVYTDPCYANDLAAKTAECEAWEALYADAEECLRVKTDECEALAQKVSDAEWFIENGEAVYQHADLPRNWYVDVHIGDGEVEVIAGDTMPEVIRLSREFIES